MLASPYDEKASKDKHNGLIEKTSSIFDEIESKTVHKDKECDRRGKRSKTLSEVKPVENISTNLQSFLQINPVQKEVLPLPKLQDHVYE